MHNDNKPLESLPDPDAENTYEVGACVSMPALAHKTLRDFIVYVVGCCECMVGMEHGQGASLHILPGSLKAARKLGQIERLRVGLCDLETIMPDAVSRFGGVAHDVVFDFICQQAQAGDEDAHHFYLALPFERWIDHAADVKLMEFGVPMQLDLSELKELGRGPTIITPDPDKVKPMDEVIVPYDDLYDIHELDDEGKPLHPLAKEDEPDVDR